MDELLSYLFDEMAIEGERGLTLAQLQTSIETHDAERAKRTNSPPQHLDYAYRNFVWRSMRSRPEVRVGRLLPAAQVMARREAANAATAAASAKGKKSTAGKSASATPNPGTPGGDAAMDVDGSGAEEDGDEGQAKGKGKAKEKEKEKEKKGKGKKIRAGIKSIGAFAVDSIAHEDEAKQLDLNALHEQYGDELRFGLDEATLRFKLTGNHSPAYLNDVQYATLQLVMRSRGRAIPSTEVGAALGIDNGTMYYVNDKLIEKGLIIKFRGQFGKTTANACVATRFKDQCPDYLQIVGLEKLKQGTRNDAEDDEEAGDASGEAAADGGVSAAVAKAVPQLMDAGQFNDAEEDDEEEAAATSSAAAAPAISLAADGSVPVSSDALHGMLAYPPCSQEEVEVLLREGLLIRARLIKLLQMSNNNIVMRRCIGRRLGLPTNESKPVLKTVSRLVQQMVSAEHIRHVQVVVPSAGNSERTQRCFQLMDAGAQWAADYVQTTLERSQSTTRRYLEAQLKRYETPRIVREVTIERQITEIICNSGTDGATITQIAEKLGATTTARRGIIQVLEKLTAANITAFDDAGITELRDTEGRMRHLRYFSRLAFQRLSKEIEMDLPGYEDTTENAVFRDPKALYEFPILPHERTWTDRADWLAQRTEQYSGKRKAGDSGTASNKKPRVNPIDPTTGEPKRGRPRKYNDKEEAKAANRKTQRERKLAKMTPEEVTQFLAKEAEVEAKRKAKEEAKAARQAAKDAKAAAKGPRGRPRKALEDLTPAARKYREKVDRAAAAAAAAAAAGGADDEDELDDTASQSAAGPGPGTSAAAAASASASPAPAAGPARRGRPRKPVEELTPAARKYRERVDRLAAEKAAAEAAVTAVAQAATSGSSNYRAGISRDSADVLDALGLGDDEENENEREKDAEVASDVDELATPEPPPAPAPAPAATKKSARGRKDDADADSGRPSKRSKLATAKEAKAAAAAATAAIEESDNEVEREMEATPVPPQDDSDVDMDIIAPSAGAAANAATPAPPAAPASNATPASAATPAGPGRKKASKGSAPDPKPRVTIATSKRVALLTSYLAETRIVEQANLGQLFRKYVERVKGEAVANTDVGDLHDKKVRAMVVDQLEQRGTLKKVKCTAPFLKGKGAAPRQCVVLAHVDVPDEEVDEFVQALSQGKVPRRMTGPIPSGPNIGMTAMENIPRSALFKRYGGNPFLTCTPDELLTDPQHHDMIYEDMVTRSQLQGYLPGEIARLECFHASLLELFDTPQQDDEEDGAEIVSCNAIASAEEGVLEVGSLAIDSLPLRDLLRIVTSTPSESLRVALADKEASAKPVAEHPPLLVAEMDTPSTHEAIAEYLHQLELLRLIEPVAKAGNGKWARAADTARGAPAKYYRVQRGEMKLLGWDKSFNYKQAEAPFNFAEEAERHRYWRELQHVCANLDLSACSDAFVKMLCKKFRRTSATSKHYVVSRLQKFFLERFVAEVNEKNLLDNEERMMRIAQTVVAPLWVTLRWFEAKCDRKLESAHALKIKARATRRMQFGLGGEGDPTGINPVWSADEVARQARTAQRLRRQKWTDTVKRILADCKLTDQNIERNVKSALFPLKKMYADDPNSFSLADLEKLIKEAIEMHLAEQRGEKKPKQKTAYKTAGQLKMEAAKAEKTRAQAEMGSRHRAPRSTYKWDRHKDETLRDAVVILRARDKARGAMKSNWVALSQIFPTGNPPKARFKKLCAVIGESAYLDELQVEWTKWWERYRGTEALPDPDPFSATNFDLQTHVNFLQEHVPKDEVLDRVERGEMEALPSDPVDIEALIETYHFETTPAAPEHMWDVVLEDSNVSITQRVNQLRYHAFTYPTIDAARDADLPAGLAQAFVKMSIETSDDAWSTPVAEAISATIGDEDVISHACQVLQDAKVIRVKQSDRRGPGNNFVYADGAFPSPFHDLDHDALSKVRAEIEKNGITAIPTLDNVHTAAIVTLLSELRLEPEFDLSCIDKIKNADMFNAKKLYDANVEMDVTFKPTASDSAPFKLATTLPTPLPALDWLSEDADDKQIASRVDAAWFAALKASDSSEFVGIGEFVREALANAGKMGVLKDELKAGLLSKRESMSIDTVLDVLESLSHASPPLFFCAGYDAPRLISAAFVRHWALNIASRAPMDVDGDEAAAPQLDKYVFPRLWLDLHGTFSSEAWERSVNAVVSTVYLRPGITFTHLVRLLAPTHDRLELVELVDAACQAKMLQKQALPTLALTRPHEPEWIASGDDVVLLPPGVDWSPFAAAP